MGDFDEQLKEYRKMREQVALELSNIARGERRIMNGVDRTLRVKDRNEKLLLDLDACIAAYEAHNIP